MLFLNSLRWHLSRLRSELQRATPSCPRKVEIVEKGGSPNISAGYTAAATHASPDPRKAPFEPGQDYWAHLHVQSLPAIALCAQERGRGRQQEKRAFALVREIPPAAAPRLFLYRPPTARSPHRRCERKLRDLANSQRKTPSPTFFRLTKPTMRGKHISIHRLTSAEAVRAFGQRLRNRNGKR